VRHLDYRFDIFLSLVISKLAIMCESLVWCLTERNRAIELNRYMSYRLTASFGPQYASGEATESVSNAARSRTALGLFSKPHSKPQGAMYGVYANQVFQWRMQYRQGLLGPGNTETVSLLPVRVTEALAREAARSSGEQRRRPALGMIHVDLPKG
jgi:hypothetical protein